MDQLACPRQQETSPPPLPAHYGTCRVLCKCIDTPSQTSAIFWGKTTVNAFGSQSMAAPLRRVLMRSANNAMRGAERSTWHYGPGFDPARAAAQHSALAELVAASGAAIEWIEDSEDGLSDSVFTHDPS